jgi:hypothetical protein
MKQPHDILNESILSKSDRIVFWENSKFYFSDINHESIANILLNKNLLTIKYKFQKKYNGRYSDISKYCNIFNKKEFEVYISNIDFLRNDICIDKIWDVINILTDYSQEKTILFVARKLLYNFINAQYNKYNKNRENGAVKFINRCPTWLKNNAYISYFCGYIESFVSACKLIDYNFKIEDSKVFKLNITSILEQIDGHDISAKLNIQGQLASIINRDTAASLFNSKKLDKKLVSEFYLDMGLCTYFSDADIYGVDSNHEFSLHKMHINKNGGGISMLVSFDIVFASMYLPLLVHYARNLPDINFHFLLIGNEKEQKRFSLVLNALVRAQAMCINQKSLTNISFSFTDVPNWVKNIKTFYACSRFLFADKLLEYFSKIYIMDADIHFLDNPANFFNLLKGKKIAFPINSKLGFIAPWRRCMAGNFYIEKDESTYQFLTDIKLYITRGLLNEYSWMLDQNAIAYAFEKSKFGITDLNIFERPITQLKINTLFEHNIRRLKLL